LWALIEKSGLPDVLCEKFAEGRGIDLFSEVCQRNLEAVVAIRKMGTYATVPGWQKLKNPLYTQSERRHELFNSFKAKQENPADPKEATCSIPALTAQRARASSRSK
jgi:hypothetical protein